MSIHGLQNLAERIVRMKQLETKETRLISEILGLEADRERAEYKIRELTNQLHKVQSEIELLEK